MGFEDILSRDWTYFWMFEHDWHNIIDRVWPPEILNTNPVQDLWNMFPRAHISIFIHPKQELHGFWGYITSKYWYFWFKINHFFGPFLGLFGVFQNFFMIHFWINEPNLDDSFFIFLRSRWFIFVSRIMTPRGLLTRPIEANILPPTVLHPTIRT